MTVQFIKTPSGGDLAVMPRDEFEDLVDGRIAAAALRALADGDEELLTSAEVADLLAAATPLAFWRKKRGIGAAEFGRMLDLTEVDVIELEAGRRDGPIAVFRKAAGILRIRLSDLVH